MCHMIIVARDSKAMIFVLIEGVLAFKAAPESHAPLLLSTEYWPFKYEKTYDIDCNLIH